MPVVGTELVGISVGPSGGYGLGGTSEVPPPTGNYPTSQQGSVLVQIPSSPGNIQVHAGRDSSYATDNSTSQLLAQSFGVTKAEHMPLLLHPPAAAAAAAAIAAGDVKAEDTHTAWVEGVHPQQKVSSEVWRADLSLYPA
jgi:hypothetical protein